MKKAYIRIEKEWMAGKKSYTIAEENGKVIIKFGSYYKLKPLLEKFNEKNNSEYTLNNKEVIRVDKYAEARPWLGSDYKF